MTPREEIISKILSMDSADDYIELNDDSAIEFFNTFVENKQVLDNLKNNYLFISTSEKRINCKLKSWRIDSFEVDSIEEVVDGSMDFRGACDIEGFDDSLMLTIKTKDFNIYEVWAVDMDDNTEVAFVEKGKYVRRMERETFQSGPQTYGNKYSYVFRGDV